jgi:hypothetical protein
MIDGQSAHLNKYASISVPSTKLRTLHLTMLSMSSQTALSTLRRPNLFVLVGEVGSGRSSTLGANQISSNFSGPSNTVHGGALASVVSCAPDMVVFQVVDATEEESGIGRCGRVLDA